MPMTENSELEQIRAYQRILVERGLIITCLNCEYFVGKTECSKFKANPPAEVILFGCPGWDQLIPF